MTQGTQALQKGGGISRRQFLALGWTVAGLVAAGEAGIATLAFMYPRLAVGSFGGAVNIGPLADVLKDLPDAKARPSDKFANSGRFYLTRTDDGILAMYRKCVHLGCVVPWNEREDQFHCPCHGSLYDRRGIVLGGPAPRPLDLFPIKEEAGSLVVDTGKIITRKTYEPSQAFEVKG